MSIRMYTEIIFSDSTIDSTQLTELLNGIIFNGGNISQHISGDSYNIKMNVPIDYKLGRNYLKRGTSSMYVYFESGEERLPIVKIKYKPKSFKKSEIYEIVVERVKKMIIDYKNERVEELITV